MKTVTLSIVALAALGLTACKSTQERLTEQGVAPMSGEEIAAFLTGNTIRSTGDGWVWHGYYDPSGVLRGKSVWNGGSEEATATWEINDQGQSCSDWDNDWGGGGYGCYAWYRDGEVIRWIHQSGSVGNRTEGVVTMIEGNPENL